MKVPISWLKEYVDITMPVEEIAQKLTISTRTVSKHVSNILQKLHLANRTQAALYAHEHRLTGSDSS